MRDDKTGTDEELNTPDTARTILDWQRCVGQVLRGRVPVR